MNKKELVAQCLAENPIMTETINGVSRDLSEEERNQAASDWADRRLELIAYEAKVKAEAQAKETKRQAILDRLGITAEEADLLLS
jgi:hypothetical protein